MPRLIAALAACLLPPLTSQGSESTGSVALHGRTHVHFASLNEGRDILATRDRFVRQMSGIDRQLRMNSPHAVSETEFLQFARQQAVSWDQAEIVHLRKLLENIRPLLRDLKPLWPERIMLVKTTGREESGAAHCRGAAIILPQPVLMRTPDLKRLLLHEMFHILSSHSAALRKELYQIVGFTECADVPLPPGLRHRKLTNPDAPNVNCVIKLQRNGTQVVATPVLYSRQGAYNSTNGRTVFSEIEFRLMVVRRQRDGWRAKMSDGQVELLMPDDEPSFHAQVGRNTHYIIHPEEILADNFVHLVLQSTDLPDPRITQQLKRKLQKAD